MCQRFVYGGCGGNANRFMSARACLETCNPHSKLEHECFDNCSYGFTALLVWQLVTGRASSSFTTVSHALRTSTSSLLALALIIETHMMSCTATFKASRAANGKYISTEFLHIYFAKASVVDNGHDGVVRISVCLPRVLRHIRFKY